jgi:hypothetical protein
VSEPRRSRPRRRGLPIRELGVLCALLIGREVAAQSSSPQPAARDASEAEAADRDSTTANVVLIGPAGGEHELALLFEELLARQGVTVEVSTAERFEPALLFGPQAPGVTRVFVVLRDAHSARLHFRGPKDERYLLRKVALPNGLDAVGRELLAQVVESSVMALVHATEGLSREEATNELARDSAPPESTAPTPPSATPGPPATPAPASPRPSPWELHLGLQYAVAWSGAELGLAHGPGLAAGARYRAPVSLGLELGAERYFAQSLRTPDLSADVQRTDFSGLLTAGLALTPSHSGSLAFGPTLELSKIHPLAGAPGIVLAGPRQDLEPLLRAELRYELAESGWSLGAAVLVDVSLVTTSYELSAGAAREVLAQPWRWRPGARLIVAIR